MKYRERIYQNYHSNQVNKASADHKNLLEQQSYYYGRELLHLLPENKDSKIVDLGCGFGSFIHAAKRKGYRNISGVDLSPEQVAVAHNLGLTEVNLQSIDDLFQGQDSFDCIVGIDIIEHLSKDELVVFLENCYAKLKPGGRVVFRTPNMDAPLASVYAFADISHETFLNKSSSLQVMNSIGFSAVEVLPSMILNRQPAKELIRKLSWAIIKLMIKCMLFATGRTWDDVVLTPNLIIVGRR